MTEPHAIPRWMPVTARVAGVWILAGCLLKAFLGTPADLPPIVRRVPLPLGTTFAVVLGIEAFVGLMALLRPGRAWPLAVGLLLAVTGVAATQLIAGEISCGCFGATISIHPAAMVAIDLAVLAVLLVSRPWRLAKGGSLDLIFSVAALVAAVALPLAVNREGTVESTKAGSGSANAKLRRWVNLEMDKWPGKPIAETSIAKALTLPEPTDGVWIFYRESCAVCADCLRDMSMLEMGARDVTLVLVPEKPKPDAVVHVHALPRGPFVRKLVLSADVDWIITTPARVIVEGGVVKEAKEGVAGQDCR